MFMEANLQKIEGLRQQFPKNAARSLILPALWMVQQQHGYVPAEAVAAVAKALEVPEIWVKEALSWYSMFNAKKMGKYHIQVCHNLSCALRGAEDILSFLQEKLGIKVGETSGDGKFSLGTVECLASCGTAPVMLINERYYENLTRDKIVKILAELQ